MYNNTNTNRVIQNMGEYLSTHRDPLSILNISQYDYYSGQPFLGILIIFLRIASNI